MDYVKKQFEAIREAIAKFESLTESRALYIYMNQTTIDKLTEYVKALTVYSEEPVFSTIYGLKIIIDNRLENDDLFISDRKVDKE